MPTITSLSSNSGEALSSLLATPYSGLNNTGTTATNVAKFFPFTLSQTIIIKRLFTVNGLTVSGNFDVGIYSNDGTKIVSSGSIAQVGTSTLQSVTISDTTLGPGMYYFAVAQDNATGVFYNMAATLGIEVLLTGTATQSTAFPLPSSVTFSSNSGASRILLVGLSTVSTV